MAESNDNMEINKDHKKNNMNTDKKYLPEHISRFLHSRIQDQLSGIGCKLPTQPLIKQNEDTKMNLPIILSKEGISDKNNVSGSNCFEDYDKKAKFHLIDIMNLDSASSMKNCKLPITGFDRQSEENAIMNIPMIPSKDKLTKGDTMISMDKDTVIPLKNSFNQLSGNVNDLVHSSPEKIQNILLELSEAADSKGKAWINSDGVNHFRISAERADNPENDLSSYRLVVEPLKTSENLDQSLGNKSTITLTSYFGSELIRRNKEEKAKKFKKAKSEIREKVLAEKNMKMWQSWKNSTNWLKKLKLMMKYIFLLIWSLIFFAFVVLMIMSLCNAPEKKEVIPKSKAMESELERIFNNQHNKVLACIPNNGSKSFDKSNSTPVILIPNMKVVKMETIYSLCSRNFKLVMYSNDGSSFNVTLVVSVSLPTAPSFPPKDSSLYFSDDGPYILFIMFLIVSLALYMAIYFARGHIVINKVKYYQECQV